ncbi:dual specificity protein phosphatase 19 [Episyrphus balteatus]|uniref:dual specificity protein phosphatase 19 n=1 Tax=Episyrphus balteatus TaxID=286459 RepID=UPI0024862778|nr:dual specificity protein phosphatase 19 [Episyrphus balteatus]
MQLLEENSFGFVVDTKPDLIPACILEDFLYLGSQDSVNVDNINKYNITHILSIGIPSPPIEVDLVKTFIECLDLPETDLNQEILPLACEFMDEARQVGGRVLVHCNAGVSRSASLVIGYLIIKCDYDFQDAYNLVKSKRECIQPNAGFLKQLKDLKR